ncbi:MAG: hypothetical protein R3A52_04525 [Polyangiales bacterium]
MERRARWATAIVAAIVGCSDPSPSAPATPSWSAAFDARELGWLLNVWGPSGDDLYAVGGDRDSALVMRFDGRAWSRVALGLASPRLHWIYGFGRDDLTAVGDAGAVLHWDGRAWTRQATPTDAPLWGVWGAAPNDLWAVGGAGDANAPPVMLHWDGAAWAAAEFPTLTRAGVSAFFKVWGTGADNVYVVGQRGVVLHRSGGAWREEFVGVSGDLVSVWGTDADHVLAVGGRGNALVARWDGRAWTARSLDLYPGLNGVWMRTPDAAHVVGVNGTALRLDLATLAPTEEASGTPLDLHAVFGDAAGRLTAVGGSLGNANGPFNGVAVTRPMTSTE